ncbi:MAG: helix-turn-helix domain-containing protein, partial [Deltaproteobacteria bacterium]|nr:helix-turn-helix domain-containing protein [Deltaproteobacteria bacterium]
MESFLTVKDIAAALKVSEVFIYKLVRENQIPFR